MPEVTIEEHIKEEELAILRASKLVGHKNEDTRNHANFMLKWHKKELARWVGHLGN